MVKQSLEKQPTLERDAEQKPDSTGEKHPFPPKYYKVIGKSPGNSVVEMAPPNGTKQSTEGTNKNELNVKGRSNPK